MGGLDWIDWIGLNELGRGLLTDCGLDFRLQIW